MLRISLVDIEVGVFQKSDRNHKVSFFPSSPLFRQLKRVGFRSFSFKKKNTLDYVWWRGIEYTLPMGQRSY
jgi:hypothetical protein